MRKLRLVDYPQLVKRVQELDTNFLRQLYTEGDFPRPEPVKDLDKRYRWDLYAAARHMIGYDVDVFPEDTTNAHIDTLLRKLVDPIQGNEANPSCRS